MPDRQVVGKQLADIFKVLAHIEGTAFVEGRLGGVRKSNMIKARKPGSANPDKQAVS